MGNCFWIGPILEILSQLSISVVSGGDSDNDSDNIVDRGCAIRDTQRTLTEVHALD